MKALSETFWGTALVVMVRANRVLRKLERHCEERWSKSYWATHHAPPRPSESDSSDASN